mgnify:CR=1 FL=1
MKTFFISVFFFFLSSFTTANIIYVDDSNTTGIENGTLQYPFNTVTEGIDAAIAGDTVYIFAGNYNEGGNLYLKDGLVITGEDSSLVYLANGFTNVEASMNHYTEISNIKFSGLFLGNGDGIATIVIRRCNFQGASFFSASGYTFIIENSTIDAGIVNASGVCYYSYKSNFIVNGIIDDRANAPPAIEAHIVENNIIYNAGFNDPLEAVIRASSESITIINNQIFCNGVGSGIKVSSGTPTNIIGNEITLNNGIPLNGTAGIEISSGEGIVTDNTITGGWVGYHSHLSYTILFENNTITKSHIGFIGSGGGEEVKNNTITNCSGDGMIMNGLRGPISRNVVKDNDGAGIRVIRNVDIGGGDLNGEGNNIIRNNGFYDLVINFQPLQPETLYVMNNGWDHITLPEILQYDIFNEGGSTNIIINATGFYTDVEEQDNLPTDFKLEQNYPNPFNPSTKIRYSIPRSTEYYSVPLTVTLKVYDVLGNEVVTLVDEYKPAGSYTVDFSISSINHHTSSGVYFYQLKAGNYIETKKMIYLK